MASTESLFFCTIGGARMFEVNDRVDQRHKYHIAWVELEGEAFTKHITTWFATLGASSITSNGAKQADRVALASEFLQLLYIYKNLAAQQGEYGGALAVSLTPVTNITAFKLLYKTKFNSDLPDAYGGDSTLTALRDLFESVENYRILIAKKNLISAKKRLLKYWLDGAEHFPAHVDAAELDLTYQYLGNSTQAKVRAFMETLVDDAADVVKLKRQEWLTLERETRIGALSKSKITWTNNDLQKAVKAVASAQYGVKKTGNCVIEITGLKAEFDAKFFAGASANAKLDASIGAGNSPQNAGVSVKASVDAMVGIKITLDATVEVADLFLLEASAEAFAGAMAKANVELIATAGRVSVKLGAEAFVGAKIKGSASFGLKFQGHDLVKGEAEGFLAAGAGGTLKIELATGAFSGTKASFSLGATVGVGGGGSAKVTVYADNLGPIAQSFVYTTYLTFLGESKKKHAYKEYFREINTNVKIMKRADGLLDELISDVEGGMKKFRTNVAGWKQLETLSMLQPRSGESAIVFQPSAGRGRSNAVSGSRRVA